MTKKNFVFDLGNVTVYYQPDEYLKSMGYEGERAEAIKRATFSAPIWVDCDAGLVTRKQMIDSACEKYPEIADDIRRTITECEVMLQPIPNSIEAFKYLTENGYDCYYLSNTTPEGIKYMSSFDYFKYFKGGIASALERVAKPDHAIFELFTSRYNLKPEDCIFIDDNMPNIIAAKECGFGAYQLKDVDGLLELVRDVVRGRA